MTPEEARRFLTELFTEDEDAEALDDAWLHMHVQRAIIKGPHAQELAQLHGQITAAEHGAPTGTDALAAMQARHAEIIAQLNSEAQAALETAKEQNGGTNPWASR